MSKIYVLCNLQPQKFEDERIIAKAFKGRDILKQCKKYLAHYFRNDEQVSIEYTKIEKKEYCSPYVADGYFVVKYVDNCDTDKIITLTYYLVRVEVDGNK